MMTQPDLQRLRLSHPDCSVTLPCVTYDGCLFRVN